MNRQKYRYHGDPGTSMGNKSFLEKFGKDNTKAGKLGEVILFHKLREPSGWMKSDMPLFCSLIPDKKYKSDIDLAVAMGNKVLLIDAKMYKSGGFYWNIRTSVFRNFRRYATNRYDKKKRKTIKQPVEMSQSMAMAKDKVKRMLGNNYEVEACVVLVSNPASSKGMPTTFMMRYPGNIKVFNEHGAEKFFKKFFKGQEYTKQTEIAERKLKRITS